MRRAASWLLALAAASCGGSDLPPFTVPLDFQKPCGECHKAEDLTRTVSTEQDGVRAWVAAQGSGMVRADSPLPTARGDQWTMPWPERGRHEAADLTDLGRCLDCHPVRQDGMGHGARAFPGDSRTRLLEGGRSCAEDCHGWIRDVSVRVAGFAGPSGPTAVYEGSLRPAALLAETYSAHARLWREGLRSVSPLIKVAAFKPGCGGCHAQAEESHGAIPSCLDCHSMGGADGGVHRRHVDLVGGFQDARDPQRPSGTGACDYCHAPDGGVTERSRAGCYNCHLSAHQPLNRERTAHFWPIRRGDGGVILDGGVGADGGARTHPVGWAAPSQHGIGANLQAVDCRECHGPNLTGGSSPVSCDSCHAVGWRTRCTYCHGGLENGTGAPPRGLSGTIDPASQRFRTHTAHVRRNTHPGYDCSQCHVKPADGLSEGHMFDATPGRAEVTFAAGLSPAGTYANGTCSTLYCHGDGQGPNGTAANDGPTATCAGCHPFTGSGVEAYGAMSGRHRMHLALGNLCAECHSQVIDGEGFIIAPELHVNGQKEVGFATTNVTYGGGKCSGTCHAWLHSNSTWLLGADGGAN
jgi:predicted CxxxxCH...CXXCH cytochrome family protein